MRMFERFKSRWLLVGGILLVLGLVSVACMQIAPRVLPSLNLTGATPVEDPSAGVDVPIQVRPNGASASLAAIPTPGVGQALVKRGSIVDVLTFNGRVTGGDETVIAFPASGQVKAIDVKLGQSVQEGDVLIETDAQDLKRQLIQAQSDLETASIRLEQARAQADADAAAQRLSSAQQATDGASQRQAVVEDAQAGLHRAQTNLEKVQAGPAQSDVRAAQAAVTTAQSAAQRAQADVTRLQRGADPAQIRSAQSQVDSAQSDFDRATGTLAGLTRGADPTAIRAAQRDVDRATATLKAAQAIPIDPKDTHIDKTRADKDAAVAFAQASLLDAQDKLNSLQQPPNPTDVSVAQGSIQVAKAKLDAAKQTLADVRAGPDQASIDQAQGILDNAQLAQQNAEDRLDEVMSHPTPQELQAARDLLKAAQTAVDRANAVGKSTGSTSTTNVSTAYNMVLLEKDVARTQALIDSLQRDLDASLLRAPFNGLVTNIAVHVDDKLTKDATVVTLSKPGEPVLRLDLTAAEGAKVSAGQIASVKFDNIDASLAAAVSTLKDGPSGQSSRIVQLDVDWQTDTPAYGTLAQVQLQVNQKTGVLLVPKKAVHTAGQRRYVQVQAGAGRKIVNVDVGIVSSESAEILTGLTEGQTVYVGP
jgi:multidrug efflux pump subunit AcrA (membrane-fusion protein)